MGKQKGGQADIFHFLTLNISKTTQTMKNPKNIRNFYFILFFNFPRKNLKKFRFFFTYPAVLRKLAPLVKNLASEDSRRPCLHQFSVFG